MKKGKFIVIEGLDGSGKSAQVDLLSDFLKQKGYDVLLRNEPTSDSKIGRKIRQILKGEIKAAPMERQKLFVQDRKEHLENKIIPALNEGKIVICSRYFFSTIAYGTADGLEMETLVNMNKDFLLPDATIIINVSPKECIRRIEERGQIKELFEKEKKLEKVSEIYKKFDKMFNGIHWIDGEKSISEVFEQIKGAVNNIL
jgi:dTMP kinase